LAAALNHSAFNTANALGPWLGGMAISSGYGFSSTGYVGAALAVCGMIILGIAWALDRRAAKTAVRRQAL
jgi:DHA1 family inner membrane transport protein